MVKIQKPKQKFITKDVSKKITNNKITKSKSNPLKKNTYLAKNGVERLLKNGAEIQVTDDVIKKESYLKSGKGDRSKKLSTVLRLDKHQKTETQIKNTKTKDVKAKSIAGPKRHPKEDSENDKNGRKGGMTEMLTKNLKRKQVESLKNKSKEVPSLSKFTPVSFDENKFNGIVSMEHIKKISMALKKLVETEVTEKKTSIFSDYRYFLNISCFKIPNCPKRMVKLNVSHSLVDTKTDDVAIIVPDLQRGAKVDCELTIQHYEDLLREQGMSDLKVVPFNQLRNECTTFEAKRKLANTYEYFLCDGRIVSHVVGFLGKHFQKPRTTLHAVHLNNPKSHKEDIERALKRTSYKQLHKGDLVSIPVGNHRFTINQLADNIKMVIEQLKTVFPGGYANIRNIYIKIDIKGTSSLPLYVNLAGPPSEVPNVVGPREQKMIKLKKQANDILSKFSLSKTGDFVKLNKTQIERKKLIKEAREALLLKENFEDDKKRESNVPLKRRKTDKDIMSHEEVEENDDNEDEDNTDNPAKEDSDDDGCENSDKVDTDDNDDE